MAPGSRRPALRQRHGFPATTPSFFDHGISYENNSPLPVVWGYQTSRPGGYEDSQFWNNAEFDTTQAVGLYASPGATYETYTRDAAGRVTGISTSFSVFGAGYHTFQSCPGPATFPLIK